MHSFNTPMMKQYLALKKQYADCLLFFRLGDFYELFMEDAHIGAKVLNITLTGRPRGKDGKIPMAGVPYHAVDTYLAKLVKAGYKVAICEQVSLASKNGLVEREVVRIVTPGTMLDENALSKKENNYIISLAIENNILSISAADISTGYFATTQQEFKDLEQSLKNELTKLNPVECILPENLYNNPCILKILHLHIGLNIFPFPEWDSYADKANNFLKEHFKVATLAGFDIDQKVVSQKTTAALLGYLKQTQKTTVSHINKIVVFGEDDHLLLDRSSIINLELFSTIRDHDPRGSLLYTLDQTITSMGGRMLKDWISKPLLKELSINQRLDAVEEFYDHQSQREDLREMLKLIPDIERILSRLAVGLGNARDLITLKQGLSAALLIRDNLQKSDSELINKIYESIGSEMKEVISVISHNITDEPPIDLKIGGLIKQGQNSKLDNLRNSISSSKAWIQNLEDEERIRTGISSLKVRFNKVFGFYIEISKANLSSVPKNYIRKQTLVNGERFITPELKKHEDIVLNAQESINDLEYSLFLEVVKKVLAHTQILQETAAAIATIDCLTNFSYIAHTNHYVRPTFTTTGEITIQEGRHPVVERILETNHFVPNTVDFTDTNARVHLITGPNMAGKSVYIRQVALCILMAQMGCFVPATQANVSLVDRIFVRSGASDVITSGLSTFMVEMVETAYILNNATEHSLIVMDEIGRGTSTYDGISIAWAIAEYLVTNFSTPPKTLFATHYHELQELEKKWPETIKNYSMTTTDNNGTPIFLYTLQEGGASSSFGIAVAKLAGVPEKVITQAEEKLKTLETNSPSETLVENNFHPSTNILFEHIVYKELENLDISNMTPLEALNKLAEIKNKLKILTSQSDTLLDVN